MLEYLNLNKKQTQIIDLNSKTEDSIFLKSFSSFKEIKYSIKFSFLACKLINKSLISKLRK